jgi:hypothetical protein
MNNKVSAILMGGLGNYMFQLAATYAYGMEHNKEVVFNALESSGPHKHLSAYSDNVFKGIDLHHTRQGNYTQLNEVHFNYNELPKIDNNVLLYGYFQSEKYFSNIKDEIREMFTNYQVKMDNKLNYIFKNDVTCSVHVRRGDYLKHPNHHPTQNMSYYIEAMDKMSKNTTFIVFSDDIDWCKENFASYNRNYIFMENNKDYEDLYYMSKCNNNIICNSTFSWWGAWLNNSANKIVVAPKKWFGSALSTHNTDDLYCENWVKI